MGYTYNNYKYMIKLQRVRLMAIHRGNPLVVTGVYSIYV